MTLPDLSGLVPTKYKPLVAFLGGLAVLIVPLITVGTLPLWATVAIGIGVAVLGALGVHQVSYAPSGTTTVFVPKVSPPAESAPTNYGLPATVPAPSAPGVSIQLPQIPGLPFQLPNIQFPFPGQFTNKWKNK